MGQTLPNRDNHQRGPNSGTSRPGPDVPQVESVAAWLRWHALELTGLAVPLVLALLLNVWFLILAAPAVGLWTLNETRQARRRAQLRGSERTALTSPSSDVSTKETDRDA